MSDHCEYFFRMWRWEGGKISEERTWRRRKMGNESRNKSCLISSYLHRRGICNYIISPSFPLERSNLNINNVLRVFVMPIVHLVLKKNCNYFPSWVSLYHNEAHSDLKVILNNCISLFSQVDPSKEGISLVPSGHIQSNGGGWLSSITSMFWWSSNYVDEDCRERVIEHCVVPLF